MRLTFLKKLLQKDFCKRLVRNGERQRPDTMQVIGENDNSLDSKRSTLTGRLENRPKIVKVFGQEFPSAFQERHREKEQASWNQGA